MLNLSLAEIGTDADRETETEVIKKRLQIQTAMVRALASVELPDPDSIKQVGDALHTVLRSPVRVW
jgi:translation initiation factor 2 alpha subunit (eIF-2alpha)